MINTLFIQRSKCALISAVCAVLLAATALAGAGIALFSTSEAYADGMTYACFVGSDRHAKPDNMMAVMSAAQSDMAAQGIPIGVSVLAGDLVDDTDAYALATVETEVKAALGDNTQCYYTYGAHDAGADVTGTTGFLAGAVDCGGYYLYGIHYDQMTNTSMAEEGAAVMSSWASNLPDDGKPVLVVSHVPLHERRGDNVGAPYWVTVLNELAQSRPVLFVWGHNHTSESSVDTGYYFVSAGSSLAVESGGTQTINFAYANAGYTKSGYGSVFVVSPDEVTLRRYNTGGCEAVYTVATPATGTCGKGGDNVTWELKLDGQLILRGSGESGSGNIADYLPDGYASRITSLSVEGDITTIPSFEGCTALRTVTLSKSVEQLQSRAFYNTAIQSIDIPLNSKLTSIGSEAFATFQPNSGITSITLPASIDNISKAFVGCGSTENDRHRLSLVIFLGSAPGNLNKAFDGCKMTVITPKDDTTWTDSVKSAAKGTVTWVENNDGITYRLYNASTSEHLWTTSLNEYTALVSHGWAQEGLSWVSPTSGQGVYRLYNAGLGTHHYTASTGEIDVLVNNEGWDLDKNGAPLFYSKSSGTPVYRLYNDALSQHHLTTDENEYNVLATMGWTQEGVAFYVN